MSSVLFERVDDIERRLRGLEREIRDVRSLLAAAETAAEPATHEATAPTVLREPGPAVEPTPSYAPAPPPKTAAPPGWTPPPWPPTRPSERPARTPARPSRSLAELLETWDLLGARGLALVGGAVTLLGIAFFFVLAANHGWIGPRARVTLGGAASVAVFAAGIVLRTRYGQLHSAVAAVGAGIAGAYTTLLAAAAIYHLLPEAAGLAIAAGIAAAAVAVAIRWSSEPVAWLGLLGAAAVPALHALDGELGAGAVAFVLLVFSAAAAVSLRERWPLLLGATGIAAFAQVLWLMLVATEGDAGAIGVAGAFFALLLLAALAQQRLGGAEELDELAGSLALAAGGLALIASLALFARQAHAGAELMAAAGVVALATGAALRVRGELAVLLGGIALTLAAVGTADLLSNRSLTLVWAAESILLTGVGIRLREARFRLAGLVYVLAALVHALAVEAPLGLVFDRHAGSYAAAIPSVAALAVAAAAAAWREPEAEWLRARWAGLRAALVALAVLAALDAVSLGLVEVSFRRGHAVVSGVWALVALVAVVVGCRRRSDLLTVAGFGWLALTAFKTVAFDWSQLGHTLGSASLLPVALAAVLAGVALRVLDDRAEPLTLVSGLCSFLALVAFGVAIFVLVDGDHVSGVALLAPGALYVGLAAAMLTFERLRNLVTVLWAHGLAAILVAEAAIVQGRGTAVAFAATAAVVAVLARMLAERRLHVASLVVLGGTTLVTLGALTTPDRLVHANEHPAVSIWVLAGCVLSGAVLAICDERTRRWVGWISAGLAVYGASLVILELAERISGATVATDFQRGHTVVTALWGLIGLGLLVSGLLRRLPALRFGGLALFGLSLAKLFLYDLSALSSVTRALSFLAVGGLMLAGGFFLQKLSARLDQHAHV